MASAAPNYSLWLVPSEPVATVLSDLVTELANEHRAIAFPPHITVLGAVEGETEESFIAKTATMVAECQCKAIDVPFVGVQEAGESIFRCVYARCAEQSDLVEWNRTMQRVFGKQETFMPHLSLLYGSYPEDVRKRIVAQTNGLIAELGHVRCVKVQAWSTANTHDKWELIEEWDLQ